MTCETCGSQDVIAIQGTHYCLNCGNSVLGKAKKAQSKVSSPAAAATPVVASKPNVIEEALTKSAVVPDKPSKAEPPKVVKALKQKPTKQVQPPSLKAHPLRFSLMVSASLAIIAGVAVAGALQLKVDADSVLYVAAALLIAVVVTLVLAQGALMYGVSRAEDRRPTHHSQWWAVARSGFMDAINVNLLIIIKTVVMVIIAAGFYKLLPTLDAQSTAVHIGAVFLGIIILAWLFLALYVMRRIAVAAVMIGGLSAYAALWLSWKLYLRNGGHLLATTLETLLGRMLVVLALLGAGIAAFNYVPNPTTLQVEIGSGLAAALAVFLLVLVSLEWETRLWLHQYRHLATSFAPADRVRLLTGRIRSQS